MIGLWLAWLAWEDLRHKSVTNRTLLFGGVVSLLMAALHVVRDQWTIQEMFCGLIPGIMLRMAAHWKKGMVGEADGIVIGLIGMLFGFWKCMNLLLISLGLFCLLASPLLLLGKLRRDDKLPFLPFVLGGYVLGGLL